LHLERFWIGNQKRRRTSSFRRCCRGAIRFLCSNSWEFQRQADARRNLRWSLRFRSAQTYRAHFTLQGFGRGSRFSRLSSRDTRS
jgi:hypothetical protein